MAKLVEAKVGIESIYIENKRMTMVTNHRVESLQAIHKSKIV
jgi:hypothetical protein